MKSTINYTLVCRLLLRWALRKKRSASDSLLHYRQNATWWKYSRCKATLSLMAECWCSNWESNILKAAEVSYEKSIHIASIKFVIWHIVFGEHEQYSVTRHCMNEAAGSPSNIVILTRTPWMHCGISSRLLALTLVTYLSFETLAAIHVEHESNTKELIGWNSLEGRCFSVTEA